MVPNDAEFAVIVGCHAINDDVANKEDVYYPI